MTFTKGWEFGDKLQDALGLPKNWKVTDIYLHVSCNDVVRVTVERLLEKDETPALLEAISGLGVDLLLLEKSICGLCGKRVEGGLNAGYCGECVMKPENNGGWCHACNCRNGHLVTCPHSTQKTKDEHCDYFEVDRPVLINASELGT